MPFDKLPSESLEELVNWEPPEVTPLISHGILEPETVLLVYGHEKAYKSYLSYSLAFALQTGTPWFSFTTRQCRVLLLQSEIPRRLLRRRLVKFIAGNDLYPRDLMICSERFLKLNDPRGEGALKVDALIRDYKPEVVIIDPLYKFLQGDPSSAVDVNNWIEVVERIQARNHCAIVIIAHTRKRHFDEEGRSIRGPQELMGSSNFPNWIDGMVEVFRQEHSTVELKFTDMRHAEEELPVLQLHIDQATTKIRRIL